jgi:hypothetical protein
MKIVPILLFVCTLLFVGCGLLPPKFDATEYTEIVGLVTLAEIPNCEVAHVERLYTQSRFTRNYARHLPDNENTFQSLREINESVEALMVRVKADPNVSPTYCRMKYSNIELMTHTLLDVVGRKPRP